MSKFKTKHSDQITHLVNRQSKTLPKIKVPENVKKVLQFHLKFAVTKPINVLELKTEIQRGFYKQRLSMKN